MQRLKPKGQAIAEYMILFALLALITLLSVSTFYPKVQQESQRLFQEARERMKQ